MRHQSEWKILFLKTVLPSLLVIGLTLFTLLELIGSGRGSVSTQLIVLVLLFSIAITLLLFSNYFLLMRIEKKRKLAEIELQESKEQFQSLADASRKRIAEDLSEEQRAEEAPLLFALDLKTSRHFLDQPIETYIKELVTCDYHSSIRDAAELMTKNNCSAVLVTQDGPHQIVGILTDYDLRKLVATGIHGINTPVSQVMNFPLVSISNRALTFEAIQLMREKGVRHLVVTDTQDRIISLMSHRELMQGHEDSIDFLNREIQKCVSSQDLKISYERLPRLIKSFVNSGTHSNRVTQIITIISDSILKKLIELAIEELGPAPVPFAFMVLGSEGRKEQTLVTDQDNALIYEDHGDQSTREYFLKLGENVCNTLDQVGYNFCEGEIMAKNPKWCQSLSIWKKNFSNWITTLNPHDLLEVNIFFDFRFAYGEKRLTDELKDYLNGFIKDKSVFFFHMSRNALYFQPPLSFFGQVIVGSHEQHPDSFNIKDAMTPIVNFARIYSLKHQIDETNTLDRLRELWKIGILNKIDYEDVVQAYHFLMQKRFKHQVSLLNQMKRPDNYVNLGELTRMDQIMLKQVLAKIANFQKRLSFDFTGSSALF
ncbi:MAG: CBS domain-containing protein [SAR324 cluster bacterium]|nr:CBS domain-containing protein [SAR324 cluster bacterium]